MTFKEFYKKHYSYDSDISYSKIFYIMSFFSFLFLFSSFMLLISLSNIVDDLLQKQNIENIDDFSFIDVYNDPSYNYYKELVVYIPKRVYFYLGLSFISFLFLFEYNFLYMIKFYEQIKEFK